LAQAEILAEAINLYSMRPK